MINIDKLFDLMSDKGFQEPRTGNLFFPAYIYTYPPDKEYEMREQIELLSQKLKRPNNYLDCLVVNIYHELIQYLKEFTFAGESIFESIIQKEVDNPDEAVLMINDEINPDGFYLHLEEKIKNHFKSDHEKRVFLIIHGFGSIYPYLRASELLKNTERLIKEFKVILFYPGAFKDLRYNLFGMLDTDNVYRANYLNRLLGEEN